MPIIQARRRFLGGLTAAGAAALVEARTPLADEPPEVSTLRLRRDPSICVAPWYIAEDLLLAEGFREVRYVAVPSGPPFAQALARGEVDFGVWDAPTAVARLDAGVRGTVLGGFHAGCFELFAHEPIQTVTDLRGMRVGIDVLGAAKHRLLALMAANVGMDPSTDIEWVEGASLTPTGLFPLELFAEKKVDAFLAFPPEPQELRARGVGRVILNTTTDRPWSQYFCCMVVSNRDFVGRYPNATKRVLRALLKANEVCAAEPERVARLLVERGFTDRYDYALETLAEIPYAAWREYDAEDSMRFFALRLHQVGMIQSGPNELLAAGTDWRFLEELKRELKT
jgi:NitT/TauT family transport system substrate-binding protein